jgi:hypothetical protein
LGFRLSSFFPLNASVHVWQRMICTILCQQVVTREMLQKCYTNITPPALGPYPANCRVVTTTQVGDPQVRKTNNFFFFGFVWKNHLMSDG